MAKDKKKAKKNRSKLLAMTTDTPSDKKKKKGKTMGELGLTREQMMKAYPWGRGSGYSPSK